MDLYTVCKTVISTKNNLILAYIVNKIRLVYEFNLIYTPTYINVQDINNNSLKHV